MHLWIKSLRLSPWCETLIFIPVCFEVMYLSENRGRGHHFATIFFYSDLRLGNEALHKQKVLCLQSLHTEQIWVCSG